MLDPYTFAVLEGLSGIKFLPGCMEIPVLALQGPTEKRSKVSLGLYFALAVVLT